MFGWFGSSGYATVFLSYPSVYISHPHTHTQCTDAAMESSLPSIQYNFRSIAEIESIEPNTLIGRYMHNYAVIHELFITLLSIPFQM